MLNLFTLNAQKRWQICALLAIRQLTARGQIANSQTIVEEMKTYGYRGTQRASTFSEIIIPLLDNGLVSHESYPSPGGTGRPKRSYKLTAEGTQEIVKFRETLLAFAKELEKVQTREPPP